MKLLPFFRLLRPHQWTKNLLCLLPLLLSHRWQEHGVVLSSVTAAVTFSLMASLIYVINDMMDVEADRAHPKKRMRPLASGMVSMRAGLAIAFVLVGLIVALACWQPWGAQRWLIVYLLVAVAYSWRLKDYLALDVVVLSLFYGLRVLYGGAAAGIQVSVWTMVFCLFLFLTLALVKRYSEVDLMDASDIAMTGSRRPYRPQDRAVLLGLACASSNTAILVVGLYLNSPEVRAIHQHPQWLWLLLPALVYWLARVLIIMHRGQMHHDPVVFALRDRASWLVLAWILAVLVVSR